ncbi:MAG: T9SS type A sorting domain-containing protein [Flavobacteriales bacterium]
MSKLLRTVSFASASLKALALAIVFVLCGASDAFAQPSINCPSNATVSCIEDLSDFDATGWVSVDNSDGFNVSVVYSDNWVNSNGNPCRRVYQRTFVVTFTQSETEFSLNCTQQIQVKDLELPQFINAPSNVAYQCPEEVPAFENLTAFDRCGDAVVVEQFGSSSSADDTLVCDAVTTPAGPGQDWAVWIDGLFSAGLASTDWYRWVGTPSLVFSNDGEARLIGDVVALNNPSNGWHVDMTMAEGVDWAAWSANGGLYMDNLGLNGATHTSWNFYKLLTTISRLEGFGAFEGDQLILSHQPANYAYGFQFGAGANNRNTNNGGSGWFFYHGNVNGEDVNGHGDVTLDMGCTTPNQPDERCSQTIERRWSATDACGNVAYHTQIISVNDTTAPTFISCPANVDLQCAADVPAPVSAADVNAADNCTGDVVVEYAGSDTVTTNGTCNFAITHRYTATDVCGNRSSCSYTITVNDTTAPELTVPAGYTVECNDEVTFGPASATDNCSSSLNIMESVDTLVTGCVITYTRNFAVSDDCGNTTTGSQTINVIDTTAPVLNIPANYTVECNDEVVFAPAAAFDNCADNLSIIEEVDTVADGNDCSYTYTRTFTVSDLCGNTTSETQTINVIDTEAPAFVNLVGPYAVECDAIYDEQWVRPAATDNCDNDLTYTYEDNMTSGGCLGTIHRTMTITDNCGNATTEEFVIYIQDTTAPVITWVPADATVECSNVPSAPGVDAIQTTDNCGDASAIFGVYAEGHNAEVTVSFEQQIIEGSCAGSYTILWIWTAKDYCDNVSTATTTITVVDTTAPVFISNPENITIDCGDEIPGAEIVVAADNCSSDVIYAISSDNTVGGSCAGQYLIERVYTATDACGNVATFTQNIFVEDTTAPIFNADNESTFVYECDEDVQVVTPVAVDDCSGVSTQYTDEVNAGNCASYITRTWTATDGCGNQSSFVQNISILDTTAPVIDFVAEIDRPCEDYAGIYATATDNCDTDVAVVWVGDDLASGACAGRVVRTYSATDDCGNTVQVQQIITLTDTTAPVAINQPENITVECGSQIPSFDPSWVDNCTNELTLDMTSTSDSDGCTTVITETYTASDVCGNTGSVTRIVTVIDTTNPVIVGLPENVTIDCGDVLPAVAEVTAIDNCDSDVTISSEDNIVPGNCAGSYLVERTYRATDNCGNQAVATQNIYVTDTTAPIFNAENESTFVYECNEFVPVVTPVAVDNCSGVEVSYSDEIIGDDCDTFISRVWTATDGCGNSSTFVQNITITDSEAPVIAGEIEIERPCDDYQGIYVTASDNCSDNVSVLWIVDDQTQSGSCAGEIVRTYGAYDDCGNFSSFVQIIQLIDNTAPVCSNIPAPLEVDCGATIPTYFPLWADQCDNELVLTENTTFQQNGCVAILTTVYTATDDCGNVGTVTRVVSLVDTTAPVASNVPANQSIECSQFNGGMGIVAPTFTDNCNSLTETSNVTEEIVGCNRVYTYEWTATDECGNATSVSATITVFDQSNPIFTSVPTGGTFACDGGINYGTAEAMDACGLATVTFADNIIGSNCPQTYTIIRTWTATDDCGNTASATSVYNVIDDVNPVFTSFPADASIECDVTELPAAGAEASDNCDGQVSIDYVDMLVAQNNCQRTYERIYTATDACGNSVTQIQQIFVNDTTAPVFSGDATITVSCNEFDAAGIYVTATDNCGEAAITILYDEPTGVGCGNSVIRHYAANDGCANSSYFNQTIVVTDTDAPVASADPADATYSCNENWSAAVVEFNDNCDSEVEVSTMIEETGDQCEMVYHYMWIATDNCGNTTVVDQYITVLDETAPVFDMESSTVTVDCGTEVSMPTPTATDNCSANVTITSEQQVTGGNCESNYTVVTTYTATDNCGNASSISYTVNYQDTTAPVWAVDNATDFTYECNTTADVVEPVATDNCSTVDYLYTDGPSESNGCISSFVRSWIAIDACGNASAAFNQTISFEDTTAPTLVGCPGDLTLACDAQVPAAAEVSATDNCDSDVTVTMVETCIGCPADGNNGYELSTPVRPVDNPCNYPYDWAMALFSLPSNYRWYQLDTNATAEMVYNADGSVTVTGRVYNVVFPDGGFEFNVTYSEGKDWGQWSTDGTPSGFKADCGGEDGNYQDWMYYILQAGANVELTGWGSHAGSLLNLTHAPSNEYFGFQIGDGANNYNDAYGAGGWFNYSGVFLYQGQPVSSGLSGGIGDFAFEINQCPEYSIIRSWTAIDCAGNTSSCSQTILFSSQDNNLGMVVAPEGNNEGRDEEISIVSISPNPMNNHSTISFTSTANGKLTLDVMDMTGRIVGSLFNNEVVAGQVYTADFDANRLATGIYMVRLSSGTAFEIERLQIQK